MFKISRRSILAASVAASLTFSYVAHATTLLSENFDELTPGSAVTAVGAFHAVSGTNVDVVGSLNGSFFPTLCAGPESGNCVDLNGSGGNPQGILMASTPIQLSPGTTYFLSFDLIGSQRGTSASVTVDFGPYDQTFNLTSADNSSGIVVNTPITVSALTQASLTFSSNTSGNVGLVLDNVSVTTSSASVPEPASLTLLAFGVTGLVTSGRWVSRRRRA